MARIACFVAVLLVAAGCAAPPAGRQGSTGALSFSPSAVSPQAPTGRASVSGSPAQIGARLARLAGSDAAITLRSTASPSVFDLRYSGPAAGYLDCGSVRTQAGDYPASTERLIFADPAQPSGVIERGLTLDIRTVLSVEPAQVALQSDYLAVETIARRRADNVLVGQSRELAAADPSGRLDFRSGTDCVVTGAWEQRLLGAFSDGQPVAFARP